MPGWRPGGHAIAAGGAALITTFAAFEVYLTLTAVVVACGFATAVGVFFGFYPGPRESRLLPVDCIRYQ